MYLQTMHEYSLVQRILRQAESLRKQHQADEILAVRVVIGEFSGVEADLLQAAYEDLSQGTCAENSMLEIEKSSLQAKCEDCGLVFSIRKFRFVCPECESQMIQVVQGEELILESLLFKSRD